MKTIMIIALVACLASIGAFGQENAIDTSWHSHYVFIKRVINKTRYHHPPFYRTITRSELESVPIAMCINRWDCTLKLFTGCRTTYISLSFTGNESVSLDDKSKAFFILQDGSTVAGISTGLQETFDHLGPGYPYTYNFIFKMDTVQLRKLTKSTIKSGCLYMPRGSFYYGGRLFLNPDDGYYTLNVWDDDETEEIRKTAQDFLNLYIKNSYESEVTNYY